MRHYAATVKKINVEVIIAEIQGETHPRDV